MADALSSLQSGETPQNSPPAGKAPELPKQMLEPEPKTPPTAENPACDAARAKRQQLEDQLSNYRDRTIPQYEEAWIRAANASQACLSDMDGCASDGKKYQEYKQRENGFKTQYDAALEQTYKMEAGFYTVDQEILANCPS